MKTIVNTQKLRDIDKLVAELTPKQQVAYHKKSGYYEDRINSISKAAWVQRGIRKIEEDDRQREIDYEDKLMEHTDWVKKLDRKDFTFTSSFHTSELAGLYKATDSYVPGFANCVNVMTQWDKSFRVYLTDGYRAGSLIGRYENLEDAINSANNALKTGNDYYSPII